MSRPRNAMILLVVLLGIASIVLAVTNAVSTETVLIFLGVGLLVLSAAVLQK